MIPARGGSKGLYKKNLKLLNKHPLISWPIKTALNSKYIDKVVVSTDSNEIAKVAKEYGAELPAIVFHRKFEEPTHVYSGAAEKEGLHAFA